MQSEKQQPWLGPDGNELCDGKLREVCQSWDQQTWDEYLARNDIPCEELLVLPSTYKKCCEEMTESFYEYFDSSSTEENRALCESLLKSLPPKEEKVLRLSFLEGKTDDEIASLGSRTRRGVTHIKNRALRYLRRGTDGDKCPSRQYMRGTTNFKNQKLVVNSIWTRSLHEPIREAKVYDPTKCDEELGSVRNECLRNELARLSPLERKIIYLRFWCNFSLVEIAREMDAGFNVIDQVCDATVSRLKQGIIERQSTLEGSQI